MLVGRKIHSRARRDPRKPPEGFREAAPVRKTHVQCNHRDGVISFCQEFLCSPYPGLQSPGVRGQACRRFKSTSDPRSRQTRQPRKFS